MLPNDPFILLSVINTKLRDFYKNLDLLCDDLDENKEEIIKKLNSAGFYYNENTNRFE